MKTMIAIILFLILCAISPALAIVAFIVFVIAVLVSVASDDRRKIRSYRPSQEEEDFLNNLN
jgi:ABC-type bacteriocin/lantibiotic exporter with double-glycine peptidase domain